MLTQPQIPTSNNQIREYKRETKENNYTIKLPITENNLIYLPTTEAETLVRVWFLHGERDIYGFGERGTAIGENKERRKKNRETKEMEFGAAKKRLGMVFWVGHVSC